MASIMMVLSESKVRTWQGQIDSGTSRIAVDSDSRRDHSTEEVCASQSADLERGEKSDGERIPIVTGSIDRAVGESLREPEHAAEELHADDGEDEKEDEEQQHDAHQVRQRAHDDVKDNLERP